MALRALTAGLVCGVAFCLQACATTEAVAPNPLTQRAVSNVASPQEQWQMQMGEMNKETKGQTGAPVTSVHPMVASDGPLKQ